MLTGSFERQGQRITPGFDTPDRLLFENYEFLHACCAKVVGLRLLKREDGYRGSIDSNKELAAEDLFTAVIERLQQDNFKALREFTGKANISTYLTTIVVNLARDRHRSANGRERSRERAEESGEAGRLLHYLVMEKDYTPEAAHEWLVREKGMVYSLEQVVEIITKFKGRKRVHPESVMAAVVVDADFDAEDGGVSFTLRDEQPLQDERLISGQKEHLRSQLLDEFINGLSGEERLMLRMRFPADEEEQSRGFAEIGRIMGMSEKAVDHRVRRLLTGFRERLLNQGVGLHDLLENG